MTIRFAVKEDEGRITAFIKEHWKGNPTLIDSPEIFRYQYMTYTECGFVLAEDKGEIIGIKGYLPLNKMDCPDIAAALAIVVKGSHPMLNMEMQRFLEKGTNCRMVCSTGLNPNTAARIYPLFRYKVDKLKHYYMLGDCSEYRIASVVHRPARHPGGEMELVELATMEEMQKRFCAADYAGNMPYKDDAYLQYRYYDHPFYRYQVYGGAGGDNQITSLLIGREITHNGSNVFRIVDFVGNRGDMPQLGTALNGLINTKGYEYIDFYCYGFSHESMCAAGFTLRDENDPNIIPNYFEPFVLQNIDIVFFCKQHEDFLICKSDGDQDRPNWMVDPVARKEDSKCF